MTYFHDLIAQLFQGVVLIQFELIPYQKFPPLAVKRHGGCPSSRNTV